MQETPNQRAVREAAEHKEREAIFQREHLAKSRIWHNAETGVMPPFGIPCEAGPGPTQSNDSPGADDTGLKA